METLLQHIDHLVDVAGIDHVGLGFDFALKIMPDAYIQVNGYQQKVFDVINGYGDLPALTQALLEHGYGAEDIRKIYGVNFMRMYQQVLS